jgi:hypothetical protein
MQNVKTAANVSSVNAGIDSTDIATARTANAAKHTAAANLRAADSADANKSAAKQTAKITKRKPKPVAVAPVADKPAPATNVHRGTVSTALYSGVSEYLNANRKTNVSLANYAQKNIAAFSARTNGCLSAMRKAYGSKPFPVRGFDNAVISMLAGSVKTELKSDGKPSGKTIAYACIKLSGGLAVTDANGVARLTDAPGKPLIATLTANGLAHGKA